MRTIFSFLIVILSFGLVGCGQETREEINVPATTMQQSAKTNTAIQQVHPSVLDNSELSEAAVEPAQTSQNATDDNQEQQHTTEDQMSSAALVVASHSPQPDSTEHAVDNQVTTQERSPTDNNETDDTASATQ